MKALADVYHFAGMLTTPEFELLYRWLERATGPA